MNRGTALPATATFARKMVDPRQQKHAVLWSARCRQPRGRVVGKSVIPLFPLNTVLFIDGQLPLRIFEPRYIDMVGRCMREQAGFGVVLIRAGQEARLQADAQQPSFCPVGTYAEITDFNQLPNGLLGIVSTGKRQFQVLSVRERADHLLRADVEFLPEEPEAPLPEEYRPLGDLLHRLLEHPVARQKYAEVPVDLSDARSVSWRLAELLPVEAEVKQALLVMASAQERLAALNRIVEQLQ